MYENVETKISFTMIVPVSQNINMSGNYHDCKIDFFDVFIHVFNLFIYSKSEAQVPVGQCGCVTANTHVRIGIYPCNDMYTKQTKPVVK